MPALAFRCLYVFCLLSLARGLTFVSSLFDQALDIDSDDFIRPRDLESEPHKEEPKNYVPKVSRGRLLLQKKLNATFADQNYVSESPAAEATAKVARAAATEAAAEAAREVLERLGIESQNSTGHSIETTNHAVEHEKPAQTAAAVVAAAAAAAATAASAKVAEAVEAAAVAKAAEGSKVKNWGNPKTAKTGSPIGKLSDSGLPSQIDSPRSNSSSDKTGNRRNKTGAGTQWLSDILDLPARAWKGLVSALLSIFIEPLQKALQGLLHDSQGQASKQPDVQGDSVVVKASFSPFPNNFSVFKGPVYPAFQGKPAVDVFSSQDASAETERVFSRSGGGRHVRRPDPIGITLGSILVIYGIYSLIRSKREADRIISLFEASTAIKDLSEKAARGEPLPSIVVVRGYINSDSGDIGTVSTQIDGLREHVGKIEQPKNAWIEIARQAKRDPQLRGIADAVVERTGVDADDVPDVPEPLDPYSRQGGSQMPGSNVVSEILVARICAKHQRRTEDRKTKKVTIKRPCRNESYNCFHSRRVSEGLHLIDLDGTRADLELPPADAVGLAGIAEPPPLFLPVSDVWTEFTHYLRKEGGSGSSGDGRRLDDLPPMRLSDPCTLLSEFIFIDVQSPGDLGGFSNNPEVLTAISEAYKSNQGPAKFLWEPRGFYDSVRGGSYDDVPPYTSTKFRRTEMVSAQELLERAEAAARENSSRTPYCEPTFTRQELVQRRNQENCFRYTELAIQRGAEVTVLARPMIAEAGTGEGVECRVRLVSPLSEEDLGTDLGDFVDSKADRFRFRILKGHRVENLLMQRDVSSITYYGLIVIGLALSGWAGSGYPGMGA
eukprot:TRINITY_DN15185_c0_g1_i1.p1 TRINITY_DN15185_c0_g1~~TRINITY_DN15185_c0_g1_i1.p1  ORF type:complete len:836 (-),score=167.04 TRINITY_DN15185_c0_g1_i1:59-2566(-)